MHSMDLKANKFRHYKGDPWHYVSKDAEYLNKFVCYPNMADLVVDKKKVYAEKLKKIFMSEANIWSQCHPTLLYFHPQKRMRSMSKYLSIPSTQSNTTQMRSS